MTPNVCPLEPFRLRNCALVVQSAAQKAQGAASVLVTSSVSVSWPGARSIFWRS